MHDVLMPTKRPDPGVTHASTGGGVRLSAIQTPRFRNLSLLFFSRVQNGCRVEDIDDPRRKRDLVYPQPFVPRMPL